MSSNLHQSNRARAMWLTCLASAFRTALACAIVGGATLYGPASFLKQVAFPAFSYVTVILVVTDATFGDTVKGCYLALYATIQTLGPAIFSLWLIGPTRLTSGTVSVAVALAAFVVALPESTHVLCKRIALGQIVINYVLAYINGAKTEPIMHPIHVAASTFVGVIACVLALLLPFPRLACNEMQQNSKLLAENASERMKLLVKALCAEDKSSASGYISRVRSISLLGSKLLQNIKRYHESMQWERLPFKFLKPHYSNPGRKTLQDLEIPLRGMEIALSSCSFPVKMLDENLKDSLLKQEELASQSLKEAARTQPRDPPTVPEPNSETIESLQTLQAIPECHKDLPAFFFLCCMKLLHKKSLATPVNVTNSTTGKEQANDHSSKENEFSLKGILNSLNMDMSSQRLLPAFKCSLSLGLAIFLGSKYSKENGFWAGLPVAISHAAGREATFKVANVKLQGTVLGTVYGVLGCFLFHKILPVRFLSLLPWFIFTSFLRQSKMYGQGGGISAVIGAVLVLGRKNFGSPKEFAIARIVETFIGLACSIMVELLFQPKRASTLAKVQLSKSFSTLHSCIGSISLQGSKENMEESLKKLRVSLNETAKFIGEAEVEPNFWFLPFHNACYGKLLGSLSKMGDLLYLCADVLQFQDQESQKIEASWKGLIDKLEGDIEKFRKAVCSSMKCLEEVTSIKSLASLENEFEKKKITCDLETGKCGDKDIAMASKLDEEEMEKMLNSFLQHSHEVVDKIQVVESKKEQRGQMVLCLTSLAFCLDSLIKETRAIEEGIKEALQWENPSSQVNLPEIMCKIKALHN